MHWKTIISFTDTNKPYRFKVASSKSPLTNESHQGSWYDIQVDEIDEFDNKIDSFNFRLNPGDSSIVPVQPGKPLLLIAEQMMETVIDGTERWE